MHSDEITQQDEPTQRERIADDVAAVKVAGEEVAGEEVAGEEVAGEEVAGAQSAPATTEADDASAAPAEPASEEDALRGVRFISRYESRSHMHRLHPLRLWRLVVGLGLLLFGIVNIFIPGPGGSVIILAALLVLAGESRLLARLLDWAEVRFQRQVDWALRHKVATVFIVSGSAFVFTVSMAWLYAELH